MTPEESIKKLKEGKSSDELKEAKRELKRAFKDEIEKKAAFRKIVNDLDQFSLIDREKNKIAFIYGLKLAAGENGKEHFPLFSRFIISNIQDDSGNVRKAIIELADSLISSMLLKSDELSKEDKEIFSRFIDEILILLENYYDSEYDKYVNLQDLPPSKYKSLEMLLGRIMNPGKKDFFSYDKKAGMPEWMDCTWRRNPCMKKECPICSRIRNIEEATDLFDRGEFFIEIAEEEEDKREDLPEPEEFPFYIEVRDWIDRVVDISEKSRQGGEFWIFTEEAADLFWYINVLSAKLYRQLCNRYMMENSDDRNFIDYRYTKYVLTESIKKIKKALKEILKSKPDQREEINLAFEKIADLEERVLNI